MKIIEQLEKLSDMGKTKKEKQTEITISEVFFIWNHLVLRYDILETTNILINFIRDEELKMIVDEGIITLGKQINSLEYLLIQYGIPFPPRGPKESKSTVMLEVITDRYIYRHIHNGIKTMLPSHVAGVIHSNSSKVRDLFRGFLIKELDLFDKLSEYGKLKSYTSEAPFYKSS